MIWNAWFVDYSLCTYSIAFHDNAIQMLLKFKSTQMVDFLLYPDTGQESI